MAEIHRFVAEASAGGLIMKWLRSAGTQPIYGYKDNDLSQITMGNFSIMFVLLICLLLLTSTVFILEKIVFKAANGSKSSKFSIFLEMLIDGELHFLLNDIGF